MAKYRKKPVVIDAFKWTGDINQTEDPEWIVEYIKTTCQPFAKNKFGEVVMLIETLEGVMTANQGDYIIKGVQGEIYPCKPEIFEQTYEKVVDARNLMANPYEPPDMNEVLNSIEQQRKYGKVYSNDGPSNIRSTF